MNGLVLSGGGGKGAYQIGVWKALRRLHYKIDIVTGTSVGSLNALLITQNSWFIAPIIWNKIDFSEVFQDDIKKNPSMTEIINMYGKNIIENQGMSTDNLEKKLDIFIRYKKFYKSKINFGLVTYNLTTLKPKTLTKMQIRPKKLKDYLIASCTCFPAFKLKDIDGNKYIDGGYCDMLPINLAIDMGADNIIAVDLKTIGVRKKVKDKDVKVTYIYPRNNIGYTLLFDKKVNKRNFKYGYNDTMKTFNKLEGNKYTFRKNTTTKLKVRYLTKLRRNVLYFLNVKSSTKNSSILKFNIFSQIILDEFNNFDILKILEKLAKVFNIPDENIYSIDSFNTLLKKKLNLIKVVSELKLTTTKKEIIKYLYISMINNELSLIKKVALIYPNEFIYACYLYTITKGVKDVQI